MNQNSTIEKTQTKCSKFWRPKLYRGQNTSNKDGFKLKIKNHIQ